MSTLKSEILRLRSEGMSYRSIQKELGCSRSTIAYHCSEVQKQRNYARSVETKREKYRLINEIKNNPCMDCGNSFPPECMDFDHVEGKKTASIGRLIMNVSWQEILDEIAKCELVCANCHRIRTKARGSSGWMV